jgi:hypothetical protein
LVQQEPGDQENKELGADEGDGGGKGFQHEVSSEGVVNVGMTDYGPTLSGLPTARTPEPSSWRGVGTKLALPQFFSCRRA